MDQKQIINSILDFVKDKDKGQAEKLLTTAATAVKDKGGISKDTLNSFLSSTFDSLSGGEKKGGLGGLAGGLGGLLGGLDKDGDGIDLKDISGGVSGLLGASHSGVAESVAKLVPMLKNIKPEELGTLKTQLVKLLGK